MSDVQELPKADDLKQLHDIYAVTHQVLTQKVQWYQEEFEFVNKMVEFYKNQIKKLKQDIEALEPKKDDDNGNQEKQ